MYYYQFGEKMTDEAVDKLIASSPGQAGGMLLAMKELGAQIEKISEDQIIDAIEKDLKKYSPRAKDISVIPGFVAYYRASLGKLPEHILVQTKDNSGSKSRGGGRSSAAETMLDPITGEMMANVFKRAPVKNPGVRGKKVTKIVTEETLEEMEDDEPNDDLDDVGGDENSR